MTIISRGLGVVLLLCCAAAGAEEPDPVLPRLCNEQSLLEFNPDLQIAQVREGDAKGKLIPQRDGKGCPGRSPACGLRTPLSVGTEAVVAYQKGDYVCAWFQPSAKAVPGGVIGWLPIEALDFRPVAVVPPVSEWKGNWIHDERHRLTITPEKTKGRLSVLAEALTAHAGKAPKGKAPGPTKLNIDFLVQGAEASAAFLPRNGQSDVRPASKAQAGDCVLRLSLAEKWMLVRDNGRCDGRGAGFSGVYTRAPRF